MKEKEIEKNLTIILPTLNEEKNIGKLLTFLKKNYKSKIIVVDDGSKDRTQEIVKKMGVELIDRRNKKVHGLTISVVEGIRKCKTPYFLVMDADFQHPPEKIKEFIKGLKKYDLVVGWRKKVSNWEPWRRFITFSLTILGKAILKMRGKKYCKDILSGYFAGNKKVKEIVVKGKFIGEGYKILFEILKQANDLKIKNIPYVFNRRKEGKSKAGIKQFVALLKSYFS
ncbi:MAG: glycosyltransferase [Candidatus Micrarchaeia archaeon]|jgi:dolichol-phosphate mannosyltransferase